VCGCVWSRPGRFMHVEWPSSSPSSLAARSRSSHRVPIQKLAYVKATVVRICASMYIYIARPCTMKRPLPAPRGRDDCQDCRSSFSFLLHSFFVVGLLRYLVNDVRSIRVSSYFSGVIEVQSIQEWFMEPRASAPRPIFGTIRRRPLWRDICVAFA